MINQESDQGLFAGYKGGEEMPLAGYATLIGIYNAAFAAMLLAAKNAGCQLPERIGYADLLLLGVATHKLSRLIATDRVTSPLRAPFTEYEGPAGASEVKEKVRGRGIRRAMGDLITCPFCIGPWVAAALCFGLVFKPRATRLISSIFTAIAISDFLQHAADAVAKKKEG
jgi:hypothetical protein